MSTITRIKKHLIRVAILDFQKFSPFSWWWEELCCAGQFCCRPQEVDWNAWQYPEHRNSQSPFPVPHFFQQDQTDSSKAILCNSTNPYEILGANDIETITLPQSGPFSDWWLQQLISSHFPCSALSKLFFLLWSEGRNHVPHADPSPVSVMNSWLHDSSG